MGASIKSGRSIVKPIGMIAKSSNAECISTVFDSSTAGV